MSEDEKVKEFSQEWWFTKALGGTSGDMVFDILRDWKRDISTLEAKIEKLTDGIKEILYHVGDSETTRHQIEKEIEDLLEKEEKRGV